MQFAGIEGNEAVKGRVSLLLEEERFPHAVLLEGEPGSGAEDLAYQIAMALVCSAPAGQRPCRQCSHCRKAQAGSHPDIWIAEGRGTARSFHVDTVRQIRADAYIKPNEAAGKVYLLLGAQAMSPQAQNALLKVLEEPPPRVTFLLTCPSASALLPTVRSRVQIFSLEAAGESEEEQALSAQAGEIARAVVAAREDALLFETAPLVKDRERLRRILEHLSLIFRDACVRRAGGTSMVSGQWGSVSTLCQNATRKQLLAMLEVCEQWKGFLLYNGNMAVLVTGLCIHLRRAAGR